MYLQPFFMRSVAEAVRACKTLVNEPRHNFNAHPSDYTLVQIGDWDEARGLLRPETSAIHLCCLVELIETLDFDLEKKQNELIRRMNGEADDFHETS